MMGPVSAGSSGNISELKSLLELVSDPQKVRAALSDLDKVYQATKSLLEEKSAVETNAEKLLKQIEAEKANLEIAKAAYQKEVAELLDSKKVYAAGNAELAKGQQQLKIDLMALEEAKKSHAIDVDRKAANLIAREKSLISGNLSLDLMKADYEGKLAKLKQAIGG